MRSKKILTKTSALIFVAAVVCLILVGRFIYMSSKYPSPQIETFQKNDVIQIGNYEITLTDCKWGDGEVVHQICPGYMFMEIDGEEYPTEQERVGLAKIVVRKTGEDNTILDLSEITFESGAWGNQFDLELFSALNPSLEGLVLELEKGEEIEVVFPITMLDMQFSERAWKNIDERNFYIVLQYYPVKYQIQCR